jgi:hypothetical protein
MITNRLHCSSGVRGPRLVGRALAMVALAALLQAGSAAAQGRGPPPPRSSAGEAVDRAADRVQTVDHSLEIYISNKALQAQYIRNLNIEGFGPVEARGSVLFTEERDVVLSMDALTHVGERRVGEPGNKRRLEYSVGVRPYAAFLGVENQDEFGLGIGGEASLFLGRGRATSIRLSAFYSPDIMTFGEADNISDVGLRLMTQVRDATDVFVGYRLLKVDSALGHRNVDDHLHIGFRRSF